MSLPAFAGVGVGVTPDFPSPLSVGDTIDVNLTIQPLLDGDNAGNDFTVSLIELFTSCDDFACTMPNPGIFSVVSTPVAGTGECSGVNFAIATDGATGKLTFTPDVTPLDLTDDTMCTIPFQLMVVGLPPDADGVASGIQTRERAIVEGQDATTEEPGQGVGSDTTTIEFNCGVTLDKQISCDGGTTWVDAGFADGVTEYCQGFDDIGSRPADQIKVRFFAQNTSDPGVALTNCVLSDADLTGLGITLPSVPDLTGSDVISVGGEAGLDVGMCTLELDDSEPNTASIQCDCAINEQVVGDPVTDSDTAEFRCDTCEVQVTKDVSCDLGSTFSDDCTTWSAGEFNEAEPVQVRYQTDSLGSVDVSCTPTDGGGLTDNNALLTPLQDQGMFGMEGGPGDVVQELCSDELDDGEPDTAMLNCLCKDRDGNVTNIPVSDSDTSNFSCETPGLEVTKVCDQQADNSNAVHVTAQNTGDTLLEDCEVTELVYLEDASCPADVGEGTPVIVSPAGPFNLNVGDPATDITGTVDGLEADACNTVSITCKVAGAIDPETGLQKEITDTADDVCETVGGECLTRTPGFWGTHPNITSQFLPLDNCGIPIDNVMSAAQGSAIEDMCSVGTDPKTNNASNQQVQLERQCMAAVLNVAATADVADGSCENAYPGTNALIDQCCTGEGSICTSSLGPNEVGSGGRTINSCIGLLDAFNNSEEAEPEVTPSPFDSPGPADPSVCQASKNNGFLNERDRAFECKGKNCP